MRIILNIILFAVILLIQVLLLNHINLWGYATPFLYIWLILKLPYDMPRGLVITIGFFTGLIIDVFCNTPGMNAFAASTLAFMRLPILFLFIPKEDIKTATGGMAYLDTAVSLKYKIFSTLLFCMALYIIESFSLFNFLTLLLKIVTSTIITVVMILGVESMYRSRAVKN